MSTSILLSYKCNITTYQNSTNNDNQNKNTGNENKNKSDKAMNITAVQKKYI